MNGKQVNLGNVQLMYVDDNGKMFPIQVSDEGRIFLNMTLVSLAQGNALQILDHSIGAIIHEKENIKQ